MTGKNTTLTRNVWACAGALFIALAVPALAQEDMSEVKSATFDSDVEYDITYTVAENIVQEVDDVIVRGVVRIGETLFLEVEGTGFGKNDRGMIRLDSIKSILPDRAIRVQRFVVPRLSSAGEK